MNKILITLVIICAILYLPIVGWHKETADGEHTGYITSVERTGIFFKTFRAYLKTDPQSSQEDAYCVVDPQVYAQLEQLSEQKVQVTVSYFSWLISGMENCGGEDAVIFYVIPTQDISQREATAKAVVEAYEANDAVRQKEVADLKVYITKTKGREATFSEIEQALEATGKISASTQNSDLQNCLNKVNKDDPLGILSTNTNEEASRQDCINKYSTNSKNPLDI